MIYRTIASAVASLVVCCLSACGGADSSTAQSRYGHQQFSSNEIAYLRDVPYSVRPNENGAQITSDSRAAVEIGAATLTLLTDILLPPGASAATPQPLLVWIHGGGMVAGDKGDLLPVAESYARAGYVVASINYRLTPRLSGDGALKTHANTQAAEDVMSAIRFLRANAATYGIDATRVATIGYSAGGELSLINAVAADELDGAHPDYPEQSAKVQGAISTGATLVNSQWNSGDLLKYDAEDSPVLLLHANPTDAVTHATWAGNVLPTAQLINSSGNTCTLVGQADMTHTADMSFAGPYFPDIEEFLADRLRLPQ